MESFQNTDKDSIETHFKSINGQREGDWICKNCQNLNFSFRKKCNRCKIQMRDNNHISPVYFYYYHQPYCQSDGRYSQNILTPPKNNSNKDRELPSVSPLLKKYRASKGDQIQNAEDSYEISNKIQSLWGNLDEEIMDPHDSIQILDALENEELELQIRKIIV